MALLCLAGCDGALPPAPEGRRPTAEEPAPEVARPGTTAPTEAEACARALAEATPAAVRSVLDDLGYDVFADACSMDRAEREHALALCEALSVSTLRDRCASRVAIASAHPEMCPEARTLAGRDPLCVALAAHDRRLCGVAGVLERSICEAALGRPAACAQLPEMEREGCRSRAADLGARVQGEPITRPALETSMTLTRADGSMRAVSSAERGARITYRGCTRVLALGDETRLSAPFGPAGVAFEVVLPDAAPAEVALTNLPPAPSTLGVTLDGSRVLHASAGTLRFRRIEPALGGIVEATFQVTFAGAEESLDGVFTTFVRDVDAPPPACAPATPE